MKKILSFAAVVATVTIASSVADARGGMAGGPVHLGGASSLSPGHSFQSSGAVSGTTGASGYSPGHQMPSNGSVTSHSGASSYAPGPVKR